MTPWTIGWDEPFDEYECDGSCGTEDCTCLEDQDERDLDYTEILEQEHERAERYHESYPDRGWSPA